jgi:hypothetical protein
MGTSNEKETTMLTKKIVLAVIAGTTLLAASGAYARDDFRRGFEPRYFSHHHRYAPRFVYRQVPPPYYYAPQAAYYPPAPVYYAPPRPVLFGTLPLGDARVRFGLQF